MFIYNIIICVLVLCCIENVYGKVCNDCVVFQSCPAAADLAINHRDEDTKNKFLESFCGYEYLQLKRVAKVCCSDFTATAATIDPIESHPNVKLLPESCGDIDGHRIIGGRIAKLYEFPWMALISFKIREGLQFQCGGSIISSKYILTAGHCVAGNKKIAGVRIGEFDIRYKTDCQGEEPDFKCESHLQDIRVENIIHHPDYAGLPSPQNDIALLRLQKPIDFTHKNAQPICLPVTRKLRNVQVGGQIATVAGWGLTENDNYSPVLLKVNITVKTGEECRSFYNRGDSARITKELCAGEYKKDSCNGDSGGPLMLEGTYNGGDRYLQYGIVSHGPKKCGSDFPGVYTDVTKYMDWILDNMKE